MGTPWRIEKDVCYPGRVVVPGEDGEPVVYEFTPRDLAAMQRTGNAKVRDNWNVPLCWEHANVHPLRRPVHLSQAARDREYAKSVFGSAAEFVIRDGPNGPRLRAVLTGDDPDDLKQFRKVGFVSPEITWDWRDTDGKVWHGPTITHIAATPRPVQRHQDRVSSARLSLAAHAGNPARFPDPRLPALTPRVGFTLRLSHTSYAEPTMPDDITMTDAGTDAGTGKASAWDRIKTALAGKGIMLGDSEIKDESHLADLIEVACLNSADTSLADDDMEDDEESNAPPEGDMSEAPLNTSEPPPPPVQMSLREKALHDRVVADHQRRLVKAAGDLMHSGRVQPALGNELVSRAKKVQLSLTPTGDIVPNPLTNEIAAYQRLEPNSAWSPVGKPKGAKGGKRVKLSQTGRGGGGATRDVGRSQYQEDGEVDTGAVVDAFFATVQNPATA